MDESNLLLTILESICSPFLSFLHRSRAYKSIIEVDQEDYLGTDNVIKSNVLSILEKFAIEHPAGEIISEKFRAFFESSSEACCYLLVFTKFLSQCFARLRSQGYKREEILETFELGLEMCAEILNDVATPLLEIIEKYHSAMHSSRVSGDVVTDEEALQKGQSAKGHQSLSFQSGSLQADSDFDDEFSWFLKDVATPQENLHNQNIERKDEALDQEPSECNGLAYSSWMHEIAVGLDVSIPGDFGDEVLEDKISLPMRLALQCICPEWMLGDRKFSIASIIECWPSVSCRQIVGPCARHSFVSSSGVLLDIDPTTRPEIQEVLLSTGQSSSADLFQDVQKTMHSPLSWKSLVKSRFNRVGVLMGDCDGTKVYQTGDESYNRLRPLKVASSGSELQSIHRDSTSAEFEFESISAIKESGVQALFVAGSMSQGLRACCVKEDVLVVQNITLAEAEMVAQVCNISGTFDPLNLPEDLENQSCHSIEVILLESGWVPRHEEKFISNPFNCADTKYLLIQRPPEEPSLMKTMPATVILCAPIKATCMDLELRFKQSLSCLKRAVEDGKVIQGFGDIESLLSSSLKTKATGMTKDILQNISVSDADERRLRQAEVLLALAHVFTQMLATLLKNNGVAEESILERISHQLSFFCQLLENKRIVPSRLVDGKDTLGKTFGVPAASIKSKAVAFYHQLGNQESLLKTFPPVDISTYHDAKPVYDDAIFLPNMIHDVFLHGLSVLKLVLIIDGIVTN